MAIAWDDVESGNPISFDVAAFNFAQEYQPEFVDVSAIAGRGLMVTWDNAAENETGYLVQRSTSLYGTWSTVTTTGADATQWLDTSATPGVNYFYRVTALGAINSAATVSGTAVHW